MNILKQITFSGISSKQLGKFKVYHDESLPIKRWLFLGLLWIPIDKEDDVLRILETARQKEGNYRGEIHFAELPGTFAGEYNQDARIARDWMKAYESVLCQNCYFSALGVDFQSPAFQREKFKTKFHVFNRFTAIALKSAIAWHLGKNYDEVQITLYSDDKSRQTRPDKGLIDNFPTYIPEKVEFDVTISRDLKGKPYPKIQFTGDVISIKSDEDTKPAQFIQLTDLLLGSVQEAVVAESKVDTKVELASIAYKWIEDIRKKPWYQRYGMHRKFSFWGFPDKRGCPFKNIRLNIQEVLDQRIGQGKLF